MAKMVGIQKHLHSLKVRKGLKQSWLNSLKKNNRQKGRWDAIEADIANIDRRIKHAELTLNNFAATQ